MVATCFANAYADVSAGLGASASMSSGSWTSAPYTSWCGVRPVLALIVEFIASATCGSDSSQFVF